MGKRGPKPGSGFKRNDLEAAFEEHLKAKRLGTRSLMLYMRTVHRFLKHIGNTPIDRVSEDDTRAFFARLKSDGGIMHEAFRLSAFLRWAWARLPVLVGKSGGAIPRTPAVKDAKEIALRQQSAADKLEAQKKAGDDLIAKLARKVIDHYLCFKAPPGRGR